MRPGEVIRQRRLANGLTQRQLATRSGSTQAAVSRLERGEISPTFETFERLLEVMGEEAELVISRSPGEHHSGRVASARSRQPTERFIQALSWNRLAGEFAREGSRARSNAK